MAKRRSAIERAPLTRELIAAEAADLIREEGLEALTMRTVATSLGVSAMALYHHVEDKDEIIRLVGDDILAKIDLPDPESGDWRELLIEAGKELNIQPLTYLAYVAANCHTALAQRPEVDPARIGVAQRRLRS